MRPFPLFGSFCFIASLGFAPLAVAATGTEAFVKAASMDDHFEIATSTLALDKTRNTNMRDFAQSMVDDHSKADKELKSAIQKTDLDADLAKGDFDASHQATLDTLTGLTGQQFDNAYLAAQKDAHTEAIAAFSDYAQNGDNPKLKDFATSTLPTLKSHQAHLAKL